ncbi:MAG: hypothetical protein J5717_00235 [Lachnospiraceae bacterium]|nr:hypothetical protein [Lachnospiraceae bacterium]
MDFINDLTYIKDMKHLQNGAWHQYDVLIDARGYGWSTMIDWADYVRKADISDVQQVTTSTIAGGRDVDLTAEYKAAGSVKAMKSLATEQGVLSIAGMSKVLRAPMKIVWFNQTQVLRFFTPLNDELQVKKYAETVIRRNFGTADQMKLGKPQG